MSHIKFKMQNEERSQYDLEESSLPKHLETRPLITKHLKNPQSFNLGIYDDIKLDFYMGQDNNPQLLPMLHIDSSSLVSSICPEFVQLMDKYSGDDITFYAVVGNTGAGKSFFCDKILNLSKVHGNYFSKNRQKGLLVWSQPFVKGDLKIFMVELAGYSVGEKQFELLLYYLMLVCSCLINVKGLKEDEKGPRSSAQQLQRLLTTYLNHIEGAGDLKLVRHSYFPEILFNLSRQEVRQANSWKYILHEHYLPDALNPRYKGQSSDLADCVFLAKTIVNEHYIRAVSTIFRSMHSKIPGKKIGDLTLNGNVVNKLLFYANQFLNKAKIFDIEQVYEMTVNDLYATAYNYCVISYHEDLQEAFEDEKPKKLNTMFSIFETASRNILQKFSQFNLDKKLHQEYERRLVKHVEDKEQLLLQINQRKTEEELINSMKSLDYYDVSKLDHNLKTMTTIKKDLDHGRTEIVGNQFVVLLSGIGSGNNVEYRAMKEIERLNQEKKVKTQALAQLNKQNKKNNGKIMELEKRHEQLEKDLTKKESDLKKSGKKNSSGLEELERQKLREEDTIERNEAIIKTFKDGEQEQINRAKKEKEDQLLKIKDKQKVLQNLLDSLDKGGKGEAPKNLKQSQAKPKEPPSKPKNPPSKVKDPAGKPPKGSSAEKSKIKK